MNLLIPNLGSTSLKYQILEMPSEKLLGRGRIERVEVVRTGDSLEFAHELMRKHHVRCLPVVEATGRLIGLLSITDVIESTSLQGEPRLSANSVSSSPRRVARR